MGSLRGSSGYSSLMKFRLPPQRYVNSEPYPVVLQEDIEAGASYVSSFFKKVFFTYTGEVEVVKVTPSYVTGSMSLIDVLDYVTYADADVEAVKVTPSYVPGSMELTATIAYQTYSDGDVEAVKVTPSYVTGSMSLPTVVQYITYSNADVEAVKVTPSYIAGSMTLQ